METRNIYVVFHSKTNPEGEAVNVATLERPTLGEIYDYIKKFDKSLIKRALEHRAETHRLAVEKVKGEQKRLRMAGKFAEAEDLIIPRASNRVYGINFTGKIEKCHVTRSKK